MNTELAKEILDKVVGAVFGFQNPLSLEEARQKFAFDLHLPQKVNDATTGEATWTHTLNPSRFITMENSKKHDEWSEMPSRPLNSIEDVIAAWGETNFTTVERQIDSFNVAESDLITASENIYRSSFVRNSKNVIFTEDGFECEYVVAGSRSRTSTYSIRVEDSQLVSNSFNILWCAKITNCFFMQDCYDMQDSMFCSHMGGKRFCIANMQYTEEEYKKIKAMVVEWVLTS